MFARIELNRVTTVVVLLLVAALVTSCCSTWKTQSRPPRDLLLSQEAGNKPPDKMRVRESNGAKVVVYRPSIREDSLVGEIDTEVGTTVAESWNGPRAARTVSVRQSTSIPLDSIRTVELRQHSTGKTVLVWGAAYLILSAFAIAASGPIEFGY